MVNLPIWGFIYLCDARSYGIEPVRSRAAVPPCKAGFRCVYMRSRHTSFPMPLYVILGKLTQKAIEDIKSAPERDAAAEQIIKEAGGKLLAHYYTFGRYDFIDVLDLPSAEALAQVYIAITKWGTITTETMSALLPEQVYKVVMESRVKSGPEITHTAP
jgi:uncharacterized protein with GYD domain